MTALSEIRQKRTQNTFLYSVKASVFNGFQREATFYFPIWWYVAPHIIATFVESYDFTGKTMIPFATSGGSGMGKTLDELKKLCPNAAWKEGKLLNRVSEKELAEWADRF